MELLIMRRTDFPEACIKAQCIGYGIGGAEQKPKQLKAPQILLISPSIRCAGAANALSERSFK